MSHCKRCGLPPRPEEDGCGRRCMAAMSGCMARIDPLVKVFFFFYPIVDFFLPISVTFLAMWLLVRPYRVTPHVATAMLTQLNLTSTAAPAAQLSYDLSVDLRFRNPHGLLSLRYLDLVAAASYGGERLGGSSDVLPVFTQRPKEARAVQALFQGTGVPLGAAAAETLRREAANGTFHVLVTVTSSFMYKVLFQKEVYYYSYECYLPFPVPHAGVPQAVSTPGIACAERSSLAESNLLPHEVISASSSTSTS